MNFKVLKEKADAIVTIAALIASIVAALNYFAKASDLETGVTTLEAKIEKLNEVQILNSKTTRAYTVAEEYIFLRDFKQSSPDNFTQYHQERMSHLERIMPYVGLSKTSIDEQFVALSQTGTLSAEEKSFKFNLAK